ncbi:hypothetical protein EI94DRAFT_1702444 [Lactarius quietus]|nr:hypothetical protein EI94DRAFT_1702444 [Lactarius quietus]
MQSAQSYSGCYQPEYTASCCSTCVFQLARYGSQQSSYINETSKGARGYGHIFQQPLQGMDRLNDCYQGPHGNVHRLVYVSASSMTVQVLTDSGTEHPLAATEAPPNSLSEEWTVPSSFVHRNCEPEWEPGNEDVSSSMTQYPNSEGEDDDDVIAVHMAQDERRLEPHRPPMSLNSSVEQDVGHSSDSDHTPHINNSLPNRREAELNLERCPITTRFKIQEKLGLTFKNTRELNQLINTHLPGQPPFQRKEILVGQECICVLFGDPDFTQDLIFRPEKHYVNEERMERMYHDMHTGSWWWLTQVRGGAGACMALNLADKDAGCSRKGQTWGHHNPCAYFNG